MPNNSTKSKADTKKFIEMVAKHQGWQLNPDQEFIEMLIDGLTVNFNRYGYYCCPCRDGDGKKELDKDIICPCKYSFPDIQEYGHCFCGLYLSNKFFNSGKAPMGIPERRPL